MKITIEKDDGTKVVVEGPGAVEEAKRLLGSDPLPVRPYTYTPWIGPLCPAPFPGWRTGNVTFDGTKITCAATDPDPKSPQP